MATAIPLSEPELEVEMTGPRVAGLADDAELLPRLKDLAFDDRGPRRKVRVHVVLVELLVADHDVVAGELLEADPLHLRPAHRDERGAAGGHDVLALVAVAAARGAGAVA